MSASRRLTIPHPDRHDFRFLTLTANLRDKAKKMAAALRAYRGAAEVANWAIRVGENSRGKSTQETRDGKNALAKATLKSDRALRSFTDGS